MSRCYTTMETDHLTETEFHKMVVFAQRAGAGTLKRADFSDIWQLARAAAQRAADKQNAKLPPENARGLDCGFAWVSMPGNIPFARWCKAKGISSKGYPSGQQIWYSKLYDARTQSVSVHEAATCAARDVIAHCLQSSQISMGSRLD